MSLDCCVDLYTMCIYLERNKFLFNFLDIEFEVVSFLFYDFLGFHVGNHWKYLHEGTDPVFRLML